jgi:hypothetical protein
MVTRWVYRLSDGLFLHGGYYEPSYDPATQGVASLDGHPNARTQRWDGAAIRAATAPEIAAFDADAADGAVDAISRFDKVLVRWIAQRAGITLATAIAELKVINRSLP